MRMLSLSSAAVVLTASILAGCGPEQVKHPGVTPAAGVVTYNGTPVEGASVAFFSEESKKAGWNLSGRTDAAGKFEITSIFAPGTEAKGVPPGSYTAVVVKSEGGPAAKPMDMKADPKAYDEFMRSQQNSASGKAPEVTAPKSLVPTKYTVETSSDLKVKVEGSGNPNIELKLVD
jgi:hypothetical protein